ncbi:MAG TPA: L-seryl-tRNA(Sec) selenium transferase, partial [Candidatus Sulfotelmatobacter sp.]|nr:L-seryl-tRNA(Sec) selenium transferase [Candidatus Sulfotelmatobacter sp.]
MPVETKQELLKRIPPMTELLKNQVVAGWLKAHPLPLVTECLRSATAQVRQQVLGAAGGNGESGLVSAEGILARAAELLNQASTPRLREAINATGIILHTGLGRSVFPESVVDSILGELKGYCTLAVDPASGERIERDELVEPILTELTGAEAATVVNNNAAATMLVLAGLAAHKEVIVSRGQLIEIGGSFRLPEVMSQSQARLVEVGATNRTHLKDYKNAITPETAALMRVHPSNYRVVGFTSEPELKEMAELAHNRGLVLIDDLGAGALLDLEPFGLPHEPTVRESIQAGADVVLFSGDKLIGAGQAGIIVGRKDLIERLRKHPLMRAMRVDKTCLMVLERTLHLFRDPERLRREHPTYRMIGTPVAALRARAEALRTALAKAAPQASVGINDSVAYLGSGSLPTQAIPSVMVSVSVPGMGASEVARRLRLDPASIYGRIETERVRLDMRTITDEQVAEIAKAFGR